MIDQYTRTRAQLGTPALDALRSAHVAVFGIGGVGSFAVEALARCGVGALTIVDHDVVSESNRNRQLIALCSTVGRKKCDVMAERLRDINPALRLRAVPAFYSAETREEILTDRYDYVVDAIDKVTCKLDLILTAQQRGIPILSCMGTGNKLDPFQLCIGDIYETDVCPLAKVMRRELRKRGVPKLEVLYSRETPVKVPGDGETRPVPGSISFVPSCAGLMIASHVVRRLLRNE